MHIKSFQPVGCTCSFSSFYNAQSTNLEDSNSNPDMEIKGLCNPGVTGFPDEKPRKPPM